MPKKRPRRCSASKLLPVSAAERKLAMIVPLIEAGEHEHALELLLAMRDRYRLPGDYWAARSRVYRGLKRADGFLAELVRAAPEYEHDAVFQITIAAEYATDGRTFAAFRSALRAKEVARDPELAGIAIGFVNDLNDDVAEAGARYRFRTPDEIDPAARFDYGIVLLQDEQVEEALAVFVDLTDDLVDSSSVRHLISYLSWDLGRYDDAVAAVGSAENARTIPLAMAGARYHSLLGDAETAARFAGQLAEMEPGMPAELCLICEGLAYAGADQAILDALDRWPELRERMARDDQGAVLRYEATARARLGDEKLARDLWARLPDDAVSAENIEQLDLPPDERLPP